jgi:hypothetical protein
VLFPPLQGLVSGEAKRSRLVPGELISGAYHQSLASRVTKSPLDRSYFYATFQPIFLR